MTPADSFFLLLEFALEGAKDDAAQLAIYDTAATLAKSIGESEVAQLCRNLGVALRDIEVNKAELAARQLPLNLDGKDK